MSVKNKSIKRHKIEALKHARKRIDNGQDIFICCALDNYRLVNWHGKADDAVIYLKKYISSSLCPSTNNLSCWIKDKGYSKVMPDDFGQKMKATRLAWIDYMLESYEGNNK